MGEGTIILNTWGWSWGITQCCINVMAQDLERKNLNPRSTGRPMAASATDLPSYSPDSIPKVGPISLQEWSPNCGTYLKKTLESWIILKGWNNIWQYCTVTVFEYAVPIAISNILYCFCLFISELSTNYHNSMKYINKYKQNIPSIHHTLTLQNSYTIKNGRDTH